MTDLIYNCHFFLRYSLTVIPSMITTDDELIDIPENKRGCRFQSEHDNKRKGNVFSHYSQNSCLFQCQLEKAFTGTNATHCLPWDSPHVEDPISVCDKETSAYFDLSTFEVSSTKDCNCPVDCNLYDYSFAWNRQPMTGVSY